MHLFLWILKRVPKTQFLGMWAKKNLYLDKFHCEFLGVFYHCESVSGEKKKDRTHHRTPEHTNNQKLTPEQDVKEIKCGDSTQRKRK